MNRPSLAIPCTAASLVAAIALTLAATSASTAAAAAATGADTAATAAAQRAPNAPEPRTGSYQILSRGEVVINAKCDEGGYVFVDAKPDKPMLGGKAQTRDQALREACQTVDFTK